MNLWINKELNDRTVMIQRATLMKGLPNMNATEKDWWVTLALKAIFSLDSGKYLLFKGGTSLSKGWNIIERMSEDIDLCISRQFFSDIKHLSFATCENNNQIKLLRKASRDFVVNELTPSLNEKIHSWGIEGFNVHALETKENGDPIDHDSDPTTIIINYIPTIPTQHQYIPPSVKIEISCLGLSEPYEVRKIKSIIGECFPRHDDDNTTYIATVLPSRTFLEKAFLLSEEFQRKTPRFHRMSRHLYDLERLMDTGFADDALKDKLLYETIVEHRKKYYHVGGVDYDMDAADRIDFIPHGELFDNYKRDYELMRKIFIYGKSLEFEELMTRMHSLQQRFKESTQILQKSRKIGVR